MAVQHSPALPPLRPGLVDPSRQAEYPILLGDSLSTKNALDSKQLLNVRYNWKSKQIPQRQIITDNHSSCGSYKLVVREDTSEPYKYNGTADPRTTHIDSACLALVFDKDKSAFVLESISKSLNFNLTYATTKPNIEQLPQLDTANNSTDNGPPMGEHDERRDSDEDAADPQNPYDYRHFLVEARKNAEAEASTPKVFATGMASPSLGASRMLTTNKSATSLQSPLTGPSKRRKVESKPVSRGLPKTNNSTASNAPQARSRAGTKMSKARKTTEKVVSSDEDRQKPDAIPANTRRNQEGSVSRTYMPSPHIIVDEASDLTIDMGSPPPAAKYKHRINPNAFSSNSRPHSRANTVSVSPQGEDVREDSERDVEGDIEMDDGDDNDDDIEDLALPSPRATRAPSITVNRITHDSVAEDDDEDDGLAAELEAVFEQEDDGDNGAVGLVISADQGQELNLHEEESEVSEEE